MPSAIKPLGQVTLGVALADIVATPTGAQPNSIVEIYTIWVANTDTVARAVTLRYGAGVLVSPTNSLGEALSIPANTTWIMESNNDKPVVCLKAGDHLQGLCDAASKVNITAFGQETSN
jgi:hypothetical protein